MKIGALREKQADDHLRDITKMMEDDNERNLVPRKAD